MTQFTDLGLAEPILRAVEAAGYTTPTPIQAEVIPAMLENRDVLGIAQTGTGKTASFVLPLLNKLHGETMPPKPKTCSVLILAPTRELASQIMDSVRTYAKYMRLTSALIVGGAKPLPQIRKLQGGVDIVVATPGRLLDHASNGAIRLHRTTAVVLDEADQMMDLGFLPSIRQIMEKLPKERQTLLLSATMPKQIASLAQDFLDNPAEIAVAPQSRPIERITQKVIHIDRRAKRRMLVELLKDESVESAVVFTRTKYGADNVQEHLAKAGINAEAIHGNKSQGQRDRTLRGFRGGTVKILVATDIAARGIDVSGVTHVINFDLPNIAESYVHRIGRTGRAGKSGIAYSLCDSSERQYLRQIERLIGMSLEAEVVPFEVDAKPMRDPSDKKRSDKPRRPQHRKGPRPEGEHREAREHREGRPDHRKGPRDGAKPRRPRPQGQRPNGGHKPRQERKEAN